MVFPSLYHLLRRVDAGKLSLSFGLGEERYLALLVFDTVAVCGRFLKEAQPSPVFFHQLICPLHHCLFPFERLANKLRLCGILAFSRVKLIKGAY